MALMAWSPEQAAAPMELVAVMVKPGVLTKKDWVEALADRVSNLARKVSPADLARVCAAMGLPTEANPNQAGEVLVLGNLNLQTHLNLALAESSPFPVTVSSNNPDAQEAIERTDLTAWVDLALSQVSESSLD